MRKGTITRWPQREEALVAKVAANRRTEPRSNRYCKLSRCLPPSREAVGDSVPQKDGKRTQTVVILGAGIGGMVFAAYESERPDPMHDMAAREVRRQKTGDSTRHHRRIHGVCQPLRLERGLT